jgi:hypothetical protein
MDLVRLGASLLAGAVAFVVVFVGLAAALDPYVWPSALVALPIALALGVATVVLADVGLRYRAARAAPDATADGIDRARARFLGALAGTAAFLVVGTLAAVVAGTVLTFSSLVAVLFVGFPAGLFAAVLVALTALVRRGRRDDGSRPTV